MPDLPGSPPVPFSLPRAGTTAAPPGFPPDVAPNQLIASTHINAIRNSVAFWPGDVDGQNHILKNVVLQNVTGVLADPTTTKGDLIARGATVLVRVGVGANGAVLTADSTQASGLKWTPFTAAPVASVFGRTGAVVAATGDYTAAQVTNAVSAIGSYADPAWITSLNWSKIAAAPATFPPSVHTHDANAIVSGVMSPARLGTGVADQTVFLRGDGTWQVPGGPGGTVPTTRVLTAGYGLTGGGSLAVDRTFAVVDDTNIQKIRVLAAGTVIAARSAVNLIQGSNVTISAVDDAANNRVNVTIASAGGGGTGGAVDSVFGRTGAVLAQNGDYNVSQITGALADPTTSKGDILARTTAALARVAIGADGQVLTADSAQPTGVKWAAASGGVASVFGRTGAVVAVAGDYTAAQVTGAVVNPTSAKGDMMVRDNSAVQRLPAGTDGFVLTVDSAQALGVKWAAVAAGSAQTPWTSDIDGGGHNLSNVSGISAQSAEITNGGALKLWDSSPGAFSYWSMSAYAGALYINPNVIGVGGYVYLQSELYVTKGFHCNGAADIGQTDGISNGVLTVIGNGTVGVPTDAGRGAALCIADYSGAIGGGGELRLGSNNGGTRYHCAVKGLATSVSGNTTGDMAFYTRAGIGDSLLTERMRITAAGNVGIGTATPRFPLHVAADGGLVPSISVANGAFSVTNSALVYGLQIGVRVTGGIWLQGGRTDGTATAYEIDLNPLGGAVKVGGSAIPVIAAQTNVLASRALNAAYLNSSGRPMCVLVGVSINSGSSAVAYSDNSTATTLIGSYVASGGTQTTVIQLWVLPGFYYKIQASGTVGVNSWWEYV